MQTRYVARQEPDRTWSVVHEETGRPVFLGGMQQTGLHLEGARRLAERLSGSPSRPEQARSDFA